MSNLTERQKTLAAGVQAYALAHYDEGGGWDVIVECYDDEMLAHAFGKARTVAGAVKKLKVAVSVYAEYEADARNSAF